MDTTSVVELMALRAEKDGVAAPMAAALARAARMSVLAGVEDFAASIGLSVAEVEAAEEGSVAFGALPAAYDGLFADLGLDVLSLADLDQRRLSRGSVRWLDSSVQRRPCTRC